MFRLLSVWSLGLAFAGIAWALPTVDPTYEVSVTTGLVYGHGQVNAPVAGEKALLLDLYEPVGTTGLRPVLVAIHGGGFIGGSRDNLTFVRMSQEMASRGWVVVSIDYRLLGDDPVLSSRVEPLVAPTTDGAPAFVVPTLRAMLAAVDDGLTLVDWLLANVDALQIDPTKIGVMGGSAGAITSVHLAYVLDNYGISAPSLAFVADYWGGSYIPPGDNAAAANHLGAGEPPLFVVHGTNDPTVEFERSELLVARAENQGVPVEFHPIQGAGHGFGNVDIFTLEASPGVTIFQRMTEWTRSVLPATTTSCVPDTQTLCLNNGRFRVSAMWNSATGAGAATAVELTPDFGYFTFFDDTNVELAVKVLDGTGINGAYWVFAAGATNVAVDLIVDDTTTGARRIYQNPAGRTFETVTDTAAFSQAVVSQATTSLSTVDLQLETRQSLLLNQGRFRVEIDWTSPEGDSGQAGGVEVTDDTGFYWFFDEDNLEAFVKVLDGRGINGAFWVFAAGLTNVEVTIRVTDTATGAEQT
ncbi:MAG: alpha/beta hydrolase, partial [Acidobacteriota bacterium]